MVDDIYYTIMFQIYASIATSVVHYAANYGQCGRLLCATNAVHIHIQVGITITHI